MNDIDNNNEEVAPITVESGILAVPDTAAFGISLKRTYGKIRKDRADDLTRKTFVKYKRKVEDYDEELYSLSMQQENMMDLSPATTTSLIPAADFDAETYLNTDLELSLKIRNKKIQANIVRRRCNYLFGTKYPLLKIED